MSHKSLSASLAFLPRGDYVLWEHHPPCVTKAFRLHWHFCQAVAAEIVAWLRESQKPFGFIGISANTSRREVFPAGDKSHKSLSASLAFLPWNWGEGDHWRWFTVTKAFRLHWHFCHLILQETRLSARTWSQKPFGFIGISALGGGGSLQVVSRPRHKSLSASLAFLPPLGARNFVV